MKKYTAYALVFLFFISFTCGCLSDGDEEKNGNTVVFSMAELANDNHQYLDNVTKKIVTGFNSLNESDTLVITDSIGDIYYQSEYGATIVQLGSADAMSIEGDITDRFKTGDTISITLQIIRVVFLRQDPNAEVIWTFDIETFEEGWDSHNNYMVPIPQKYIDHA